MADEVRLIDAELLTTNIAQIAKNCARSDAQKALIGRILFVIENMPTIEAEPDNGWISVKDRLPEPYTMVLVHDTDGKIFTVIYKNDYLQFITGYTITHWQPLPKPPKGGIVMDEYISREAAVRYLKGYSEKELNWNHDFGKVTSSVLDKAERAISEMPAADVQPVKHGRWMYPFYCSECGFTPYYSSDLTYNYCPNCGSKLDLGGDSDDEP